jgi:hypothetical protein
VEIRQNWHKKTQGGAFQHHKEEMWRLAGDKTTFLDLGRRLVGEGFVTLYEEIHQNLPIIFDAHGKEK